MIFVTVGTHEQQFNRLIKYIDQLVEKNTITENVVIQTGYSTYKPRFCEWNALYPYPKMMQLVLEARIVITHGGPSSFIMPLQIGKIPIVVPRKHEFGEHVNNHQVEFANEVANRIGSIIVVQDIEQLNEVIKNYDDIILNKEKKVESNNHQFCEKLDKIIHSLVQ